MGFDRRRQAAWRRPRWLLSCLVVGIVPLSFGARAPNEQSWEFAGDATLELTPGKPANLTLLNNTNTAFEIALRTDGEIAKGAGSLVTIPESIKLVPGGSAVITVLAETPHGSQQQAPTTGYIVGMGGPTGVATTVSRQAVSIATTVAKPLATKWSVTSYRWTPLGDELHNQVLPLDAVMTCEQVKLPESLGGLSTTAGGGTRVTGTCTTADVVGGGNAGVALAFPGLRHATGDYTGTVDLAPDDEQVGEVELAVRRTDFVALPLFVLVLGVFGAIVLAWWNNRLSPLSEREEQTLRLLGDAVDAESLFKKNAAGNGVGYSLEPSFGETMSELRTALGTLASGFTTLDEEDPTYKGVVERLDQLSKIVTEWPKFGRRLAQLAVHTKVVKDNPPPQPPGVRDPVPAFVEEAERLLAGEPLPVGDVLDRIAEVERAASMAEAWPGQWKAVIEQEERALLTGRAMASQQYSDFDERQLAQAEAKLSRAAQELFSATDATEFATTVEDIVEARRLLDGLARFQEETPSAALGRELEPAATVPPSDPGATAAAGQRSPAAAADAIAATRRRRNIFALAVLAAVTVFTGLTVLYFDKPFGTPRDYLAMLLWGFGAQAALEALAGALDRVLGGGRAGPVGTGPMLWFPK